MSKREWKSGPINKAYMRKCKHAAGGTKTVHRKAAINRLSTVAGTIAYVPPPVKSIANNVILP